MEGTKQGKQSNEHRARGFLEDQTGGFPCRGERWAVEGSWHPVRMCKVVLAHRQGASTESHRRGGTGWLWDGEAVTVPGWAVSQR